MDFDISKALDLLWDKLETWLSTMATMLPNFILAILVLVVFYFIARGVRVVSKRLFRRYTKENAISKLFTSLAYIATITIGCVVALNILHLDKTVSSILAGAGIVGLALGFAFQDISANFISGVFMAFRKPIKVGDIIKTKEFFGTVEAIDLRVTVVRTFQGLHVLIPNKDVFQTPLINYTKTYDRRIDLEVGVSYSDDLEKVQKIALEAIESLPYLLHQEDKETKFFYTGFGDSSINFVVMLWVQYPDEPGFLQARSDAIISIKKAFDEHDITIPFPIRTLDFGNNGGEALQQHLKGEPSVPPGQKRT